MTKVSISKRIVTGALLALTLTLSACGGSELSGTYADSNKTITIEFKGDQAYVTQRFTGTTAAVKYSVRGDKVIIGPSSGGLVLTRNKDGSLGGPMGMTLVKQ